MKVIILAFAFILFSIKGDESRLNRICNRWRQIGILDHEKGYQGVGDLGEIITLGKHGLYTKKLYGTLDFRGKWLYNNDSTKFVIMVDYMNGQKLNGQDDFLDTKYATDSIIMLTNDSLIIGMLAYFGSEKIYGHDDWYYIREK